MPRQMAGHLCVWGNCEVSVELPVIVPVEGELRGSPADHMQPRQ